MAFTWYGKEGPNTTGHLVDADEWNSQREPYSTDAALTNVANTVTKTDILSLSIPAALFSSSGSLRAQIYAEYFNNDGAGRTVLLEVRFGATTMYQDTSVSITNNASVRAVWLQLDLANIASTAVQHVHGLFAVSAVSATTGQGDIGTAAPAVIQPIRGTAAEDTTSAKTLAVAIQHSAASANVVWNTNYRRVEVFPSITASP